MWLVEATSFLAAQKSSMGSADVKVLQERQKKLKVKTPLSKFIFYNLHSFSTSSKCVTSLNRFTEFVILLG